MNQLIKRMINKAHQALSHSYAPYSGYSVSSCLCSEEEILFTGVNVENSSYGLTLCAETSAIMQMVAAGKRQIKDIVVLSKDNALCSPCGACRQRIYEFSTPETRIHLCNQDTVLKTLTIDELLPLAFNLQSTCGKK
ncbi:cytidine deaminase [Legionella oakridgensis]|uniref:Cytidine deaminase n=2 Tax=Legionella oakridgensis TaxID=29423 RepID=W0BBW7_9GAMM|nr:cytidine deaminase [Legionella oakridgensis]AHE67325.1 cytidine deaminase, homotetrameric [Legionella oakridgensis ATCC 33761 = DSM 21215]ETO93075.1 cytidine deaminase [Legionella oakridgensis RV-2-2007]KTD37889.1 cytidine deaminase [Legionella oakridgensis]STY20389.1 cytidine deaminase [Legionella longbeachae]